MKKWINIFLGSLLVTLLLIGCTKQSTPTSESSSAVLETPVVTTAQETTAIPDPQPIYAGQIKEGTYTINVLSSSSMFRGRRAAYSRGWSDDLHNDHER